MRVVLVVTAAAICVGSAAAASAPPRAEHTSAGTKLAQASLLRVGDFGKGWTQSSSGPAEGLNLSCTGFTPKQNDLVEIGAAASPNFKGSAVGPFVVQRTSVYATAKTAETLWKRTVKPQLVTCVAQSLQALASRGVTVSISSRTTIPLGRVAARSATYRIVATLTTSKQRLKTYFDVVLLGSRRTVSQLTISQFQKPPSLKSELALAKIVARRIGAGGPSA